MRTARQWKAKRPAPAGGCPVGFLTSAGHRKAEDSEAAQRTATKSKAGRPLKTVAFPVGFSIKRGAWQCMARQGSAWRRKATRAAAWQQAATQVAFTYWPGMLRAFY